MDVSLVRTKMREWLDANPRYVIFAPWWSCGDDEELARERTWGPDTRVGVSFYKTARNALVKAGTFGVLCQLDFEQMRIVDATESLVTKGESRNEIGDSEFCERQAVLWMQRAAALRAAGK